MSRVIRLLALVAALGLAAGLLRSPVASAQARYLSITTDQTQYAIGSPIRVCYTVPGPGPFTITDMQADGTSHVFFSGVDDGTGGCLAGTVTPPQGTECMTITFMGFIGPGSAQTCFQVGTPYVPPPPPPPPPGPCIAIYPPTPGCGATITTDQTQYSIGSPIRVCYTVPRPGPFTITDQQADGTSHTFFSGFDDGTGGCLSGTVTPPAGTECLQIVASGGIGGSSQTCFQVLGLAPPAPSQPCIQIYPPPPGCG